MWRTSGTQLTGEGKTKWTGTVALAYALVYALVRMEDYALLVGSGLLFVMLALLMKFTGRINRE